MFAAEEITNNAANARRQIIAEYKVERGLILSRDGAVLAESVRNPDRRSELQFLREYPGGALFGQLTGYYSRVYGRSGLELAMNPYLSGDAPELAISTFTDLILGEPKQGGTIMTTIDAGLQAAAAAALGDQPGAVVATDPRTGDILAMVANPSYDPNAVSTGTTEEIEAAWADAERRPRQATGVARQRRAVSARLDRQAHHRGGRAGERVRARRPNGRTRSSSTCRRPPTRSRTSATRSATVGPSGSRWPRRSRSRATSRSPRSA